MRKYLAYLRCIAEWCEANQAWGWFVVIVVTLCCICSSGVSYAQYQLETKYENDKRAVDSTNGIILEQVKSLQTDVMVIDAKLDVILSIMENK